jgi:ubiquinone/menaquinone biosynthesis C-methylase UbiE
MKEVKDLFSKQAATYASYRPVYPDALYDYLYTLTDSHNKVWDCGTGNGQVAVRLSERFTQVYATDISAKQIENATQRDNIHYSITRAEQTEFPDDTFDLVTVGTALHWFDFDKFYSEVQRVTKDGGCLAAWVYAPFRATPNIDIILHDFYFNIIHDYWDPERKYVEEEYKTIPFPFEEVPHPTLEIRVKWTGAQFKGFLNSWSSVQHYINKNGTNPVNLIESRIDAVWKDDELKEVVFPLFMRVGRIRK